MAVFRVEKTRDYTVMSNHHLRNKHLTLKAKGLMSLLLSLPDTWIHSISGLSTICAEGEDAISQAIRELECEGYVLRNRLRNAKGQWGEMEYVIYEHPQLPAAESPGRENPGQDHPAPDKPSRGKPARVPPGRENPLQLNTDRSNMNPERKNESIPDGGIPNRSNPYPSTHTSDGGSMVAQYKQLVRNHIEYDIMCQQYDPDKLDEIVYLIVEALCSKAQYFTISGKDLPAELVRERLLKFTSSHLQYVFDSLRKTSSQVGNIKSYLLTTLYNATGTIKSYYDAQVRHDHPLI